MCRQNQLWGCSVIAFGIGILVGICLESGFLAGCLGIGVIFAGFCMMRK